MAPSLQRFSVIACSQLRWQAITRGFRTSSASNAAQAMTMPAMSPTMTEGAIGSWKVKEGDSFTAGDVLLEIETDKAQMDVEAQDDGIMAKIIVPSGSKGVPVGKRIAVLAEQGDDLSTLEIHTDVEQQEKAKEEIAPKQQRPAPKKRPAYEASVESTPSTSRAKYPQHPSPSIVSLLKANNISAEDSARIPGTGPKGRLLKGDILAHIGKINKAAPGDLEARIKKMQKLDLSNIKIAPPKPNSALAAKSEISRLPEETEIKVGIDLFKVSLVQQKLGFPLESFIIAAADAANIMVEPPKLPPTVDELFNDILGLPNVPGFHLTSFSPKLEPCPPSKAVMKKADMDIFDVLVGYEPKTKGIIQPNGFNMLSLKVPTEEVEQATQFLHIFKGFLEENPEDLFSDSDN